MLFVLPEFQGAGLGRDLLARLLPADDGDGPGDRDRQRPADLERAVRDARHRPAHAAAEPDRAAARPEAFGELPSGVVPLPFDELAAGPPDGVGHRMLVEAIDTLDRELLGAAHPADHRFLRSESRHGWLYRGPDGDADRIRLRRRGRAARAGRGPRRGAARAGPRPPDLGRRSRAARSRCGSAAPPIGRSCRLSGRASGSTSSRSSSAGTGRSRTSRATCRSRRGCCSRRGRCLDDGPVRRCTVRPVCRSTARVVASALK